MFLRPQYLTGTPEADKTAQDLPRKHLRVSRLLCLIARHGGANRGMTVVRHLLCMTRRGISTQLPRDWKMINSLVQRIGFDSRDQAAHLGVSGPQLRKL